MSFTDELIGNYTVYDNEKDVPVFFGTYAECEIWIHNNAMYGDYVTKLDEDPPMEYPTEYQH